MKASSINPWGCVNSAHSETPSCYIFLAQEFSQKPFSMYKVTEKHMTLFLCSLHSLSLPMGYFTYVVMLSNYFSAIKRGLAEHCDYVENQRYMLMKLYVGSPSVLVHVSNLVFQKSVSNALPFSYPCPSSNQAD